MILLYLNFLDIFSHKVCKITFLTRKAVLDEHEATNTPDSFDSSFYDA